MIPNPNLYPEPFEKVETDVSVGSFSGQTHIASNAQINCHFRIIFTGVTWITFYPKSSLVEIIDSTNCFLNLKTKKYQVLRFSEKKPLAGNPSFFGKPASTWRHHKGTDEDLEVATVDFIISCPKNMSARFKEDIP